MPVLKALPTSELFESVEPHTVEFGASPGMELIHVSGLSQGNPSLTGESFPCCDFLPLSFCMSKRSLAPSSLHPPISSCRQHLPALILKLNKPNFPVFVHRVLQSLVVGSLHWIHVIGRWIYQHLCELPMGNAV